MEKRKFYILGIMMMLIVISESRVIVSGDPSKGFTEEEELPWSGKNPPRKDKKLGQNPGVLDPAVKDDDFGMYEFDTGINYPRSLDPEESDKANERDISKPGINPEKFSPNIDPVGKPDPGEEENVHENVDEDQGVDKSVDNGYYEPFDGEDSDKSVGGDRDSEQPLHEDGDESVHGDADESHRDEEEDVPDKRNDDKIKHIPVHDHGLDFGGREKIPGMFGYPSIFDTPFFNLGKIRNYFNQMERALKQVFRQTVEEARLLNGTYANNTEEEVDIHGKKYIVHKSVIRGKNNHSSIYVETLSSKPKENKSREIKNTEVKNAKD